MPKTLELWGVPEICEALGVGRESVYYWIGKGGFPEPLAKLKAGQVWDAADVRRWREENPGR